MVHLNEIGTNYTKLISSPINIEHSVLIQQLKLEEDMALSLLRAASDAELSAGQTIILPLPPVQMCLRRKYYSVYKKACDTSSSRRLLSHQLDGISLNRIKPLNDGEWLKWLLEQNTFAVTDKFKNTWERQLNSHHGQAAGGHGDWLEQESGRHVNELNSSYLSCLPV